jgi:hypothetical protein
MWLLMSDSSHAPRPFWPSRSLPLRGRSMRATDRHLAGAGGRPQHRDLATRVATLMSRRAKRLLAQRQPCASEQAPQAPRHALLLRPGRAAARPTRRRGEGASTRGPSRRCSSPARAARRLVVVHSTTLKSPPQHARVPHGSTSRARFRDAPRWTASYRSAEGPPTPAPPRDGVA